MSYKNLEIELESLLSQVVEEGASDLHLIPGHPPILRIDSELHPLTDKTALTADQVQSMAQVMLEQNRYQTLLERRDLDFSFAFREQTRFRVNAYFEKGVLSLALRHVPAVIKTFEELRLPPQIKNFADHKQGLVLVAGPTGHGKSTTLAALIDYINQNRTEHIVTIEDPIEYIFAQKKSVIQQREVGFDTPSFAQAIRATLREDMNVVMVGEMRDPESMAATITVAETGHLVFATLHTNDAAQTIDRIIDNFPPSQQQQIRAQLAAILVGIISIRLVRKIGGGRIPAVETLVTNDAVRNLIRENKTYELINVVHTGAKDGMISMDQSLAALVSQNLISLEEAKLYVHYPDIFESKLRTPSFGLTNN